ncbi:hypothetical protein [Brachybacterium sp.]|uniref:hypothetical protein n=1 Tax=Brachybacterium sp. TaxID=1891286 RepID=UPI002ED17090
MTSALLGLALILLIALSAVVLGALSRLLAARILRRSPQAHRDLTVLDRIALGNELIARDLQPDSTHPVARTAPRDAGADWVDGPLQRQDLALRHPEIASHALR